MDELFPEPVLAALRAAAGRVVFQQGGRAVTGEELLGIAARLAAGMRAAGLGPGNGVALVTGLSPEAYAAHLAAHALGCRVAALRPGWSPRQTTHSLTLGMDAIVTDPASPTPTPHPTAPE
ncbi:AMP-binding protein, partial [Sphaerisporangium sp. B11E5]|uniref:AMP-binding protein n=1 Tax=Sphaerisporangium sp. B11E5 TaxID=3153563 RepID=UPI00325D88A5